MIRELGWVWSQAGTKDRAEPAPPLDLARVIDTYATTLFRVANSVLRSVPEAEDVVQDTFLRLMQQRKPIPEIRDLRPWLIRIAWNLALDRQRRIRPDQADDPFLQTLVSQDTPADRALEEAQGLRQTLRAVDRLPAPERQALLLSALEELETAEIARIMGKTESAVRALLHRARTRLRQRLSEGGPQ